MTKRTISNTDDVIDSRDVIARIEELESERQDLELDLEDAEDAEAKEIALAELDRWDNDEDGQELKILKALADEAEGYASDWKYGETLIRDSHFEDYARELASDIGAIPDDAKWPCTCIDWAQAASELQQDYTSVEFDGVTYWVRTRCFSSR